MSTSLNLAKKDSAEDHGRDATGFTGARSFYERSGVNPATRRIRWIGYICFVLGFCVYSAGKFGWVSHTSTLAGYITWGIGLLISGYGLIRFTRE